MTSSTVTVEDVAAALGAEVPDDAAEQVNILIGNALAMVRGYLHPVKVEEPLPDEVRQVVVRIVVRYLTRGKGGAPENATGMMTVAGSFTRQVNFASGASDGGVWMTKPDRVMLRPLKRRGRGIESVDYVLG
ncbi:hypothetical protein AALF15_01340 [Corynebacteriaceae bacterium 7-707]